MAGKKNPKVFISYAWEDDVRDWVLDLATRLRQDGIDAILDQWETAPGDPLPEFMENAVRRSDFVIFICTPKYKQKSDNRQGGVGYEGHIITGELFSRAKHRKFIPILRKEKWEGSSPSWAVHKLFIDLRGNPYDEKKYQELLETLLGQKRTAPPIGNILSTNKSTEVITKKEKSSTSPESNRKTGAEANSSSKQVASKEETSIESEVHQQNSSITIPSFGKDIQGSTIIIGNNNIIQTSDKPVQPNLNQLDNTQPETIITDIGKAHNDANNSKKIA